MTIYEHFTIDGQIHTVTSSKRAFPSFLVCRFSSIRKIIPYVANIRRLVREVVLSKRIEYPTNEDGVPTLAGGSPNSADTLWAKETVDILRGSAQYILQWFPLDNASSKINEGTWVDLPLRNNNK